MPRYGVRAGRGMSFPAEGAMWGDGRTGSTDSSLTAPGLSEVQQAQRAPSSFSQARHAPQAGQPRAVIGETSVHTPQIVPIQAHAPSGGSPPVPRLDPHA